MSDDAKSVKTCLIELDELRTWEGSRAAKRKFRCRGCGLSGDVLVRPAARLDEFIAQLRAWHDTSVRDGVTG